MAEYDDEDEDELPSVDHGPLNEGPWEKGQSVLLELFICLNHWSKPVIINLFNCH